MTPALLLGGAKSLWDDLAQLEELVGGTWPHTVFAINDSGWAYPHRIHYWVSLHQEKMPGWMERRRESGFPMDGIEVWGGSWVTKQDDSKLSWVDHILPVRLVGSSGFHAVEIALHLGHTRVVIAGMPMDFGPHFDRPGPWDSAMFHRPAWEQSAEHWQNLVRSLSGWTAELLGRPDREWLEKPAHRKAS